MYLLVNCMEMTFTDEFTLETLYLTSYEYFYVSIKFLLNGQVNISTPSDFCENIVTHTDMCHDAMDKLCFTWEMPRNY